MSIPFRMSVSVGAHLVKNKLRRRDKFALVLELEPLFACNLACNGCGKIQHPATVLKQRMSVEDAVNAVMECGAPIVSIAGGLALRTLTREEECFGYAAGYRAAGGMPRPRLLGE